MIVDEMIVDEMIASHFGSVSEWTLPLVIIKAWAYIEYILAWCDKQV